MKHIQLFEFYRSQEEQIAEIMKHYFITAIWTEEERLKEDYESEHRPGERDDDEDEEYADSEMDSLFDIDLSVDDISSDSRIQAYMDIKKFLELAGDAVNGIDESDLGHDIWLSRNRHGAGFFDRGYPKDVADRLMNAAHALGEVDMELGDDGELHFSNVN